MIPYIITFVISLSLIFAAERLKDNETKLSLIFLFMAICALSLLASIRDLSIGTDLRGYIYNFNSCRSAESISQYKSWVGFEILYSALSFLVAKTTGDYKAWLFVIEFWDAAFIITFLWKQRDKYSVTLGAFVMMMLFYNLSFNIIRQTMSLSVCLLSFYYAKEKNLIGFIICMLIAIGFHTSSILMVITYPLCRLFDNRTLKETYIISTVILVVTIFSLVLMKPISMYLIKLGLLPKKYGGYLGVGYEFRRLSALFFMFPALVIYVLYSKRLYRRDSLNPVLFIYVFVWPFFAQLDSISNQFGRLALGFLIANIPLYAQVPGLYRKECNKLKGIILTSSVVVFWGFYWVVNYYVWNVGRTMPFLFQWS